MILDLSKSSYNENNKGNIQNLFVEDESSNILEFSNLLHNHSLNNKESSNDDNQVIDVNVTNTLVNNQNDEEPKTQNSDSPGKCGAVKPKITFIEYFKSSDPYLLPKKVICALPTTSNLELSYTNSSAISSTKYLPEDSFNSTANSESCSSNQDTASNSNILSDNKTLLI